MEYVGFIFGVFGLMAFLQLSSLKNRIEKLERELTKIKGTAYHEDRSALLQAVREYVGQKVEIDLKEDHEDVDIVSYGNTKYGSNTVLDYDDEWMLIRVESRKGSKEKLIRLESIERISVRKDA